jgi:hypothetical protein
MAQQNEFEYFDSVNKFASENQSNKTKQQTAVEWLVEQLMERDFIKKNFEIIEQAKAMEKEQIKDAFKHGEIPPLFDILSAEQYYNETYNK